MTTATNRTLFWTMIRREMREHATAGTFAFLGVSALLLMSSGLSHATRMASSSVDVSMVTATQVEAGGLVSPFGLFTLGSVLVALLLGRAMAKGDRNGDARAFLLHRPVNVTLIFVTKAGAAVALYLLAAGIPMLANAAWQSGAGHRPTPWDARLMLRDVADLSCGLVYIVSAIVMTLRHRKFVDRGVLSLGVALTTSVFAIGVSEFWQAELIVLVALAIATTAAWGTFRASGGYESQPVAARASLGATVALGLQAAFTVVVGIAGLFTGLRDLGGWRTTTTVVTSNGQLVRETTMLGSMRSPGEQVVDVTDLAGHPLPAFRDSAARANLTRGVYTTPAIPLALAPSVDPLENGYRGTSRVFIPILERRFVPSVLAWYYLPQRGLIAAYDERTWRQIGWMAPDGYHESLTPPRERFEGPLRRATEFMSRSDLIAFPHAVYRVDLAHRTITRLFVPPADEEVMGVGEGAETLPFFARPSTRLLDTTAARFEAIATTRRLYLETPDGEAIGVVAHDPSVAGYGSVAVSRALLAPDTVTVLRYSPRGGTLDRRRVRSMPTRVVVVAHGSAVRARVDIPRDTTAGPAESSAAEVSATAALSAPVTRVFSRLSAIVNGEPVDRDDTTGMWLLTAIIAIAAAITNALTARKYAFERKRQVWWAVIGLALGVSGYLLMLALVTRPAREICESCGRKRVVTREQCEHCGAPFALPALDGTEIFRDSIRAAGVV